MPGDCHSLLLRVAWLAPPCLLLPFPLENARSQGRWALIRPTRGGYELIIYQERGVRRRTAERSVQCTSLSGLKEAHDVTASIQGLFRLDRSMQVFSGIQTLSQQSVLTQTSI